MDWLSNVSPVWREYFLGAAGDATGGLVAQFVIGLLHTARRQVRERFRLPEQTHALQNAIAGALDTALGAWTINDDESTHDRDLFRDWLLNPAVLNEFCTLLAPDDKSALNLDLLREKFEDTGLSADHLGTVSFDVLVQDIVGAFYFAAAKEPVLQESMQISLLRQMAERMGALVRLQQLAQRQVVAGEQTVDLLTQIRQFAQQAAAGQGNPNELLQNISELLTTTAQHGSSEELRSAYQQSEFALTTVGLPTSAESRELRVRLREILIDRFDESELKTFCFDLDIPYENLPGSSKADRARELVAYCERHECTRTLIQTGARLRPDIDWPGLNGGIREQSHGIPVQEWPALARVLTTLDDIHASLTTGDDSPSPEKRAAVEAHYRQTIIDQFEKLTFKGLSPSGTPIVLPLEQVYVELKAVADVPEAADTYSAEERRLLLEAEGRGERVREELALHLDVLRAERWNRQARQDMARLQRRSIQEILGNPAQRGVVILGDPGSGKTTLLHYQALRTARASGDGSAARAPLPIFVPLAAYDDFLRRTQKDCSLGDFLAVYYDQWHSLPGLAPLFQQALAEGRALVLLDGLDEVLDTTTRQFVAEQAGALIRQWASRGNRFAVTSRIVGYREARLPGDLTHVTVLDFGRTETEIFAHQWCRSYEAWVAGAETPTARQQAAAEERALLEDVRSNPSVERLAASPLLLTMLALLRRHVGKLPDRRIELYERYIRTLIDNWHTVRSPGARQQTPERFDPHTAIAYLIELAFWLQQHKPSGTARRQELEQVLETICLRFEGHDPAAASPKARVQAQQTAARFLQDMRHFAGLLAERGRDAFGFLHLTFQEYFCGRALARMEPDARWTAIQPNLHRPRWREPILLCAGQLGVVEQRRDRVSDLAQRVLNAGSAYEPILHRDLFLTAALAADNVGLFPTPLNTIAARLASLQTSPIPTVCNTTLAGLAQLARLGHAPALASLEESLRDPALQRHVMGVVRAVLRTEKCIALRQAILTKLEAPVGFVRRAAVSALTGMVASDASVRQAILTKLEDPDEDVRQAAVEALTGVVVSDANVRQVILTKLEDPVGFVRQAAVEALTGVVVSDASVRQAILTKLEDPVGFVRQAAVRALTGMVASDASVRQVLLTKLEDPVGFVRQAAVRALTGMVASDASVRQVLLTKLEDPEWFVRQAAVSALTGMVASDASVRQVLLTKLEDPVGFVRQAAVSALTGMVASDASVRQAILTKLEDLDGSVRRAAVRALTGMVASDASVRQAILTKLEDPDGSVRRAAVRALTGMVASDASVRQAILTKLEEQWYDKRRAAVEALTGMVASDASVRQAILTKLEDPVGSVRRAAVEALTGMVASDASVRQAILTKLEDPVGFVRQAAVEALTGMVASDASVRQAILTKLEDPVGFVRQAAVRALTGMVASDASVRQAILTKLEDPVGFVRRAAVRALTGMVASDASVRQAILTKLEDPDGSVRRAAVSALTGMVASDASIRQAILTKLEEQWYDKRQAAVEALTGMVASDASVRQAILTKLEDPDEDVRQAAVEALTGMVASDASVRQAILTKLEDPDEDVRQAAVRALTGMVTSDASVRQAILTKLEDPDEDVRQAAVRALTGMVTSDASVRQAILTKLEDPDEDVRQAAVRALTGMVTSDASVRQAILTKLEDPDEDVRQAAVEALTGMVVSDASVRQVILTKLEDPDEDVRQAAVEALTGVVVSDASVRQAILTKLEDPVGFVRRAAVSALTGMVASDASVRQAILTKLEAPEWSVRRAAVRTLIPLVASDNEIKQRLLSWLGVIDEEPSRSDIRKTVQETQCLLADTYAPLLATDPKLLDQVTTMLTSPAWPVRQGAAWTLITMPGGPPPHVLPTLRGLLDDMRGEESWPQRLQVAELLINDRDQILSRRAIAVALEALDYATKPWYNMPRLGSQVRSQAVRILGQLEPLYRDEAIFARLTRILTEDASEEVRDAAYGALLRLAAAPEAVSEGGHN